MNKPIKKTAPVEAEVVGEQKTQSMDIVAQEKEIVKTEADIDGFIALRRKFIAKVNAICVEGKDYHIIQGKKSLAKGGAEKIASIFKWSAKFDKDTESLEMLGEIKGLVVFKCTLTNGGFVGEGRGAASLTKDNNDPNKTLKMAQKSAFIDAVLRASGLSDFFTQDLGPEDEGASYNHLDKKPFNKNDWTKPVTKPFPPSEKQIEIIKKNMEEKGVSEADLIDNGFPPLKDLTGGKEGTASEVIGYLFGLSSYSNGLTPISDQDRIVHLFTVDLEKCDTYDSYLKVIGDIKATKENGKINQNSYDQLLKTCKVIIKKFEKPVEVKPETEAAKLMKRGMEKAKAKLS